MERAFWTFHWLVNAFGVVLLGILLYAGYQYEIQCGGHLARAANANSTVLAEKELAVALKYIEANNLTEGNTSVFFPTPANDLAFWHENIKSAHTEIAKLAAQEQTGALNGIEQTNALLKLRESLTTHGEKGESVTDPDNIAVYPHQMITEFLSWGTLVLVFGSWVIAGAMLR
jgi:hypothetical protein